MKKTMLATAVATIALSVNAAEMAPVDAAAQVEYTQLNAKNTIQNPTVEQPAAQSELHSTTQAVNQVATPIEQTAIQTVTQAEPTNAVKHELQKRIEDFSKQIETVASDVNAGKIHVSQAKFPELPALTDAEKAQLTENDIKTYNAYIDSSVMLRETLKYAQDSEVFFNEQASKTAKGEVVNFDNAPIFPAAPANLDQAVQDDWNRFKKDADEKRATAIQMLKSSQSSLKQAESSLNNAVDQRNQTRETAVKK